jgi:hypothetical protein
MGRRRRIGVLCGVWEWRLGVEGRVRSMRAEVERVADMQVEPSNSELGPACGLASGVFADGKSQSEISVFHGDLASVC